MKIDVVYPDTIRLRFMFERLPYELRTAIDKQRAQLVRVLEQSTPAGQKGFTIEKYIAADGSIFAVRCRLGKRRQDSPQEEPVQELLIVSIQKVDGVHGIK